MPSIAKARWSLAACAAVLSPLALTANAQQTAAPAAQPPAQAAPYPGQMPPGVPPGPTMHRGAPAWPGMMQPPPYAGAQPPQGHPGMRYLRAAPPQQATQMPPQQPKADAQQGMDGMSGMSGGSTSQQAQAGSPAQGPEGPHHMGQMQGPMHGPMGGPMSGPMHGPMGGPMSGPMDGPMMGGCPMMMGPHAAGRMAFIKAELGLKDNQQAAFDAVVEVMKQHAEGRQDRHKAMWTAMQSATSPLDRLGARLTMMETRLGMMKEMKAAIDKLYGALDDQQKQKADYLLPGMGGMRCMM
ncbi:MAG: Spy/CpxP family protein refolding chaperone [Hyphomicrobiaceae bacterium]|nr:Spy/CpxP family protein refolding chaperone [Hyphomicrobiaceae bacterium]